MKTTHPPIGTKSRLARGDATLESRLKAEERLILQFA